VRWSYLCATAGLLAAALGSGARAGDVPGGSVPAGPARAGEVPGKLVPGNTAFALELYARLAGQPGNLFLSPYSISTALAMTYAGARGETAREMAATLHFDLPASELHAAMGELKRRLEEQCAGKDCDLAIANALWAQRGTAFLASFLEINRDHYGAGTRELDFGADAEGARQTINGWVSEQTRERIPELLAGGDLTRLTELVLTNAIYFKGIWAQRFDARATSERPFRVPGDAAGRKTAAGGPLHSAVQVPMMEQTGRFAHAALDGFALLEMPYAGSDLVMDILLPDDVEGLPALEARLSAERLESWLANLREREVSVSIPRFKTDVRFDLVAPLAAMGMPSAFGPSADFSGMTADAQLFISKVVHQAFVQVDEEGTEAAAATAVVLERTGAPGRPVRFEADHPFLFLIRDRGTASVVFVGRVMEL